MSKNKASWNAGAEKYSKYSHSEKVMSRILENPANAFHGTVWRMITDCVPDFRGKKICVPSSGDNHAVFAFAMLGAEVTSCDIAENQLINAGRVASRYGWGKSVRFICSDTMKLDGLGGNEYDLVYTSNGVHVWINDLPGMYRNIRRVMKPGGAYLMYEIHPFQRPFNDDARVIKPYDNIGPFEDDIEIKFHWRVTDIVNAMLTSGLTLARMEEVFAEKDYDWPFWISFQDVINGVTVPREEVDRFHDWKNNPMAALPNFICLMASKDVGV